MNDLQETSESLTSPDKPTGPTLVPRLRIEQDGDDVLRLRYLPLSQLRLMERGEWQTLGLVLLVIFVAYTAFLVYLLLRGDYLIFSLLFGSEILELLIFGPYARAEWYDENRLTISDDGAVYETISPHRSSSRRSLGSSRELQYKLVKHKSFYKIDFWIGRESVRFACDNKEQAEEIAATLGSFLERFGEQPPSLLVPYKSRSFIRESATEFEIELPSSYARSSLMGKLGNAALLLFFGGYYWYGLFLAGGKFVWLGIQWIQRPAPLPPEMLRLLVLVSVCWFLLFFVLVFLPLMLLNRSYWTAWSIRIHRESGEATGVRHSLFGWKAFASPITRLGIRFKKKASMFRLLWIPHWFDPEPIWERAGLIFDFDGRVLMLPCGSTEEADWLVERLGETGLEIDGRPEDNDLQQKN